ncbi:winged helix-turn-helix domain-containing protein [Streptomyces sp. HUAS TT20]|uniref:winged helix-turn-helix domain-containing protein n=1 Tax=Streptomyces sp. HUAS TT20 TaxID=3447509 RepID=UPI0021D80CFB|nr:winged helix-turn-helix domain-containing protein [Streptomyces sp. HUAS 15-9]UXY32115.1 winged helix-turn-helix domain-containing protein [Streptomyces sp. HUAS 15-9]
MRYPDGGGLTAVERARRERVRFQAAGMFAAGLKPPQVARAVRVSRKFAYAWHAAWRAGGNDALRSKGLSGVASRMKPAWRSWLARALEQGPAAHGWTEDQRWTPARITLLVARRFNVRFSRPQLSRILRQMGLSVRGPVHRAAERDEKHVWVWRGKTWARVEGR